MNNKNVRTLREVLDTSSTLFAERPALSFVGREALTYADVQSRARQIMGWLTEIGIQKGDRVALLSQNMPNWGVAYLAITGMGAVVVPILIDFSEAEINKIIAHSEAKAIIVSEKLSTKVNNDFPAGVIHGLLVDDLTGFNIEKLKGEKKIEQKRVLSPLNTDAVLPMPTEEDLAAILYTSGTTGNPKGVMLSHRNLVSNAINTLGIQNVDINDRLLSVLPLPHTYECTIGFLIPFIGGAVVYYLEKPPTASVLLPAMKEVKPTMMLTVPLIIEKVYNGQVKPKLHKSKLMRGMMKARFMRRFFHKMAGKKIYNAFGGHLHFFGIGGAKVAAETERFLRDAGFPYAIGYGLTETAPLLAGCGPKLTKYRSTGFSLPNQQIKILNPDPITGEGEIVAKGPNVMMGYFKDPAQTAEVFTQDGWFKTGDLGVIDKDNYLFIKGRLKNMILGPSGENIYPEEIEALINGEDLVLESLVYELKGQLVAKVHLNYEELEKRYQIMMESAHEYKDKMGKVVEEKLQEIRDKVNATMNRFSRIHSVEEQDKPFEKTPTQKIKRFLYSKQHDLKH